MKIFAYFFNNALKNIWHEKWINFLAILSISIGLSMLCIFAMTALNMDSVIQRWTNSFGMVVYLDYSIEAESEAEIRKLLAADPDILEVKYISKEEAFDAVRDTLGENAVILDNMKKNPLPASLELKLKTGLLKPELVKRKAEQLEKLTGIDEVQYGEKWLASLTAISKTIRTGVIIFGCAIFLAITFLTYNTIKIFFYRRKDEIETLSLLGATGNFTRMPFLLEGLFIGIVGGCISAMAIFGAYSFTTLRIAEFFPSLRLLMISLPVQAYIIIPSAGAFMSLIGSFLAVGKIRY